MDTQEVFALLDDAGSSGEARSRLYSRHAGTLRCSEAAGWPQLLQEMQEALARGLYALPCSATNSGAAAGVPAHAVDSALAQVLLFEQCEHLDAAQVEAWIATRATTGEPAGVAGVNPNVDEAAFTDAIRRIRDYIAAGDTYQVNYTYRLRFEAFGPLVKLYARLRARQRVPYGALVALPGGEALLSFSPELFVRHDAGVLTARPMKGTAPASGDDAVDAQRSDALSHDTKNRAENLMIVDLLRNDLGRVAQTGSVEVPALFEVRRYGAVLQMTSTVQARLRADVSLEQVFAALYPAARSPARPSAAPWRSSTNSKRARAAFIPARSAGSILPRTARPSATSACRCRSVPWPWARPRAAPARANWASAPASSTTAMRLPNSPNAS